MKIISIKPVGKKEVFDIEVKDNHQYVFDNGLISSNSGTIYAADQIFIIGKSQSKDNKNELKGYNFTLNVEKSRFIKEKSKIPITVHYDSGILKYSGLMQLAKDVGIIDACRVGRSGGFKFVLDGDEGSEPQEWTTLTKDIDNDDEFWNAIFEHTNFKEVIEAVYKIPINRTEEEIALLEENSDLADALEDATASDEIMD
jgi:hypothetical protein